MAVENNNENVSFHLDTGLFVRMFEFGPKKQERKEGWEPTFAADLALKFRVLLRPRHVLVLYTTL